MRSCADLATAVRQRRTQERLRWRELRYCAALAPSFFQAFETVKAAVQFDKAFGEVGVCGRFGGVSR